jgi:hypothetical protein
MSLLVLSLTLSAHRAQYDEPDRMQMRSIQQVRLQQLTQGPALLPTASTTRPLPFFFIPLDLSSLDLACLWTGPASSRIVIYSSYGHPWTKMVRLGDYESHIRIGREGGGQASSDGYKMPPSQRFPFQLTTSTSHTIRPLEHTLRI